MSNIFPDVFQDSVPVTMKEEITKDNDPSGIALCSYMDSLWSSIQLLIRELGHGQTAERCPVQFLEELGYMITAGISTADTELIKRQKIATAIAARINQGSFTAYIKPIIDGITGFSSSLWTDYDSNYWVEMDLSDGVYSVPVETTEYLVDESGDYLVDEYGLTLVDVVLGSLTITYPWAIESTPGGSYEGILEMGNNLNWFFPGNVFINLGDTGSMSSGTIDQVLAALRTYINAAYLVIRIGYVSSGSFIIYGTV